MVRERIQYSERGGGPKEWKKEGERGRIVPSQTRNHVTLLSTTTDEEDAIR